MKKGDWVVVSYDEKCYPGKVTQVGDGGSVKVSVMKSSHPSGWKWPSTPDEIFYLKDQIIKAINPPIPTNSRGAWEFPDSILMDN